MAFSISNNKKDIPPPATNKGGVKEFAIKCKTKLDTCYEYERDGDSKGYVLNPKLDFMIVTVPVKDRGLQKLMSAHITHMLMDRADTQYEPYYSSHLPNKAKKNYHGYTHNLRITDLPGLAAIQFKPTNKTYNELKITMVPSRWTSKDVKKFWDTLCEISHGAIDVDYVIKHGNIRRLDWAIDFINVDTSDFLLEKITDNPRKNVAYYGSEGGVETYYIGPNGKKLSPQNYKAYIYDKRAKALADGEKPIYKDLLHMRFEIRLLGKSLGEMTLNSYCNLASKAENRFKIYKLTDYFAVPASDTNIQWHMFGDSCKVRGADTALEMLPFRTRDTYKKYMVSAQSLCWKPVLLWNSIPKHMKKILGKPQGVSIKSGQSIKKL